MSQYTHEEVEAIALECDAGPSQAAMRYKKVAKMLRAYAATLRQAPAQGGVTEAMVTHQAAAEALDSLDDYARMGTGVDAHGPRGVLERYIAQQAALSAEKDGWISVSDRLPECDMTPGSFGVSVEVKPGYFDGVKRVPTAFYGCRQTDEPNFYLYGAVFHPTHWRYPASPTPDKEE